MSMVNVKTTEVQETLKDMRENGCRIVSVQYADNMATIYYN